MRILNLKDEEAARFRGRGHGAQDMYSRLPDVSQIMQIVRQQGDAGVAALTWEYDGVPGKDFRIGEDKIRKAASEISPRLKESLLQAADHVRRFSQEQLKRCEGFHCEVEKGVTAGQVVIPIDRIGVYVPGGRYPLVSSLIMAAVPAQVAGVGQIAVCTPPTPTGSAAPLVLAAAHLLGIEEIYRIGGAQAVAALAFGTETVPRVDKIVGPGNSYVNAAKKWVFGTVGIDFIAGPSEVLILADEAADAACLASDLIAQAEHDPESAAILVTDSLSLGRRVQAEVNQQLPDLKTASVATMSLEENGAVLVADSWEEAVALANERAPEHLILDVSSPETLMPQLRHYGSIFIGSLATVVLGDYSAGINHILPTDKAARYTGGLSVRDFLKFLTSLHVDRMGFNRIGPLAQVLARTEGLEGHSRACDKRILA
jgi:histidinol dehydrogenase